MSVGFGFLFENTVLIVLFYTNRRYRLKINSPEVIIRGWYALSRLVRIPFLRYDLRLVGTIFFFLTKHIKIWGDRLMFARTAVASHINTFHRTHTNTKRYTWKQKKKPWKMVRCHRRLTITILFIIVPRHCNTSQYNQSRSTSRCTLYNLCCADNIILSIVRTLSNH